MSGSPGCNLVALLDEQPRAARELVLLLVLLGVVGREDHLRPTLAVLDRDAARDLREHRGTLRVPGLEDLDDARETVRDIGARDASRMEGTHRQLRARLADRLRGDDADRVADLGDLTGGEEDAVARARTPCTRAALARPNRKLEVVAELLAQIGQQLLGQDRATLGHHLLARLAGRQRLVDVRGEESARGCG